MNFRVLLVLVSATAVGVLGYFAYVDNSLNEIGPAFLGGVKPPFEVWKSLSEDARQFIFAVLTLAGVLVGSLTIVISVRSLKNPVMLTPGNILSFPFKTFSTTNIEELKKRRLSTSISLPHQHRFPLLLQEDFENNFNAQLLLILGRRGLGKARESIEALVRLAEEKGEEVTIIFPTGDFDRPDAAVIPIDFKPQNLVLFINEIEWQCISQTKSEGVNNSQSRTFHERLSATIQWMREQCRGRTWKVILTATNEPEFLDLINVDHPVFNDFSKCYLKGIDSEVRPAFVRSAASCVGLDLDNGVDNLISEISDGTPFGITTPLKILSELKQTESIKPDDLNKYTFHCPKDWDGEIYKKVIEPYEERRAIFEALSALKQLGIFPHQNLVIDLASRLCNPTLLRWGKKTAIRKVLVHDLQAWLEICDEEVLCHDAFLQGKVDINEAFPQILSSLLLAMKTKAIFDEIRSQIPQVANFLAYSFGHSEEALALLKEASHRAINYAPIWTTYAKVVEDFVSIEEALSILNTLVKNGCRESRILTSLSYLQSRMGQNDQALRSVRLATEIAPGDDLAWLNYGVVASKEGLNDEALAALNEAIRLNPKSAKAWYSRGVIYDRINEYEDAEYDCVRATELAPHDSATWHTLGIVYDRMKRYENALNALREALSLEGHDAYIWLSYGRTLCSCGKPEDAFEAFNEVEKRAKENPKLLSRLSTAYGINGNYEQAVSVAEKALSIVPNSIQAKLCLGWNLLKISENNHRGLEIFNELSGKAETASDWYRLSLAYEDVGLFAEGVSAAENAIKIDPSLIKAKLCLIRHLTNIPDGLPRAIDVQREVAEQSKSAYQWYRLSSLLGQTGRCEEAVSAAYEALKINPEHLGAKRKLGINLYFSGNKSESLEIQKEVAELSQIADDWAHLSVGLGQENYIPEAIDAAHKALELDPDHFRALQSLGRNLVSTPGREEEGIVIQEKLSDRFRAAEDWRLYSVGLGKTGHYSRAIDALRKVLAFEPDHLEAKRSLALNLVNTHGDFNEIIELQKNVARRAENPDDWVRLGASLRNAGDYEQAISVLRKALKLAPDHFEGLLGLANNLANLPGTDDEVHELLEKLAGKAETAGDFSRLGSGFGRAKKHGRAVAVLRKALELEPDHTSAKRSLAYSLRHIPRGGGEALRILEELAESEQTANDWYQVGATCLNIRQYRKGLSAVDNCLKIDPENQKGMSVRASLFGCLGQADKAEVAWHKVDDLIGEPGATALRLKTARRAIEEEPDLVENWRDFAKISKDLGLGLSAITHAMAVVERSKELGPSVMGIVHELVDVEPQAVVDFMHFLTESDQDNDLFMHLRGVALGRSGDQENAIRSFRYACELNPRKANYWYALGKAYEDINDKNEARNAYESALKINPNYIKARYVLEQLNKGED